MAAPARYLFVRLCLRRTDRWIPLRDLKYEKELDGNVLTVSVRDALLRAHELGELADPSPLGVVTQLRLMVTILYRILKPRTRKQWLGLYGREAFSVEELENANLFIHYI